MRLVVGQCLQLSHWHAFPNAGERPGLQSYGDCKSEISDFEESSVIEADLKRGSAALKRREILRLRGPADFPANPSGHFAQNDEMLGELLVRLRGGDAAGARNCATAVRCGEAPGHPRSKRAGPGLQSCLKRKSEISDVRKRQSHG